MDLAVRSIQPDLDRDSQRQNIVHRPNPRTHLVLGSRISMQKDRGAVQRVAQQTAWSGSTMNF